MRDRQARASVVGPAGAGASARWRQQQNSSNPDNPLTMRAFTLDLATAESGRELQGRSASARRIESVRAAERWPPSNREALWIGSQGADQAGEEHRQKNPPNPLHADGCAQWCRWPWCPARSVSRPCYVTLSTTACIKKYGAGGCRWVYRGPRLAFP